MATLNLTKKELEAPAGMSTIDGGYMSGYNPALPNLSPTVNLSNPTTPTGTGVSTPAPEPTVGEQLSGIQSEALRIKDILDQRQAEERAAGISFNMPTLDGGVADLPEEVDADAINRSTLKMFQDQIDATNQVYDQLLGEARLEGEGRLGSGRAMAARGGLLGSDFAASQKAKIQDFNTDEQRSIQAERTAAIGAILGTARGQAQQEIAAKRAARQQGYENYRQYLADSQNRRLNNVSNIAQAFIAQGIDPATLDEQELNAIASEAGMRPADIITGFQSLQAEAVAEGGGDFGFMSTSGGIFRTDPATGEAVFIPSGAGNSSGGPSSSRSGGSTSSEVALGGFDSAREIINSNPNLTDDQLKVQLLEKTDLGVTEINSLISTRENRQLPNFNENLTSQIVNKLRDNFDYKDAVKYIEAGSITSNGSKYTLTDEQKTQLKNALDEARGFWEKIVPGGN